MSNDYTKNSTTRASSVPRDDLHIDHPPRGITMERAPDGTTVFKARKFGAAAFGMLFFTVLWNGITSVFVCIAISMTADKFGWNLPFKGVDWNENAPPLWGMWLFLTPFILVGIGTLFAAVYNFIGRAEIRVGADEGSVFKGIGSLGRTQRFAPQSVKAVEWSQYQTRRSKGGTHTHTRFIIEMKNGREIKLPSLGKLRETWLCFALNKILNLTPNS